jgi:hypothetical protein
MRSLFEILEDPKPLRLTMTYDAPKGVAVIISLIADECKISENEVAQLLRFIPAPASRFEACRRHRQPVDSADSACSDCRL